MTNEEKKELRKYTAVQRRILAILADGQPHKKTELHPCLMDDLASPVSVKFHISNLRKKLLPKGETIICEYLNRSFYYRQVRLLVSPSKKET